MKETDFFQKLHEEFVISSQIDPPLITNFEDLVLFDEEIAEIAEAGVEVIDINSRSKLSLDSLCLAERYVGAEGFGLEVVPHVRVRGEDQLSLAKQILTAYTLAGITDYLLVTGDPLINAVEAQGVFPSAIEGIKLVDENLRRSNLDLHITLGAAINQNAKDINVEEKKTREKINAGTDFFMSQPVFNKEQVIQTDRFYKSATDGKPPLMMGLWAVTSHGIEEKIRSGKIDGVVMPEEVEDPVELVKFIKEEKMAQGIYLVAPLRKPGQLVNFIDNLKDVL